jgi:hypothetical protein
MTFLNNAFLFLLSAISIPLIIHFLSKRRIKTIDFSSLKFLEQMQKSRMRWLKIKELVLLILRMMIIAFIVLAFARPTLRGFAGSSRAASSVVIILDRSASMDTESETGTLFDEAKRLSLHLLDSFEPGDQITVVSYPGDGPPDMVGPTNLGDKLKEKLSAIDIGYQKGNIGEALKQARDILVKSPDLNHEIYIFSDLKAENFGNLPKELFGADAWKNIHLFTISPKPTSGENVGISDVLLPAQLLVPGENFDIEAELTNYGQGTLENVLVGVIVDGERKAQTTLALPPNQPTRFRFNLKLDSPGDHSGYVEIDHDTFEPDNKRYFSLHMPDKINLLVVDQITLDNNPVKLALDRPEAGQIAYNGIVVSDLLREDLAKYNVILLDDIPSLDPSRESAITRFVESGGGLFISLGKQAEASYWQKFLPAISAIAPGALAGRNGEYITWDNFDYEHPIFSIYSPDKSNHTKPTIPEIKLVFYHNLTGGKSIGSGPNGLNLLTEATGKPVIVFGSGLDLNSGDLAAHSFFIPLLVRSIEYLGSQNTEGGSNGIIGESVQWRLPIDASNVLSLQGPSGSAEDLQPTAEGSGSMVKITEYGEPGIYTLKEGDKKIGLLAFNIDNSESRKETISAGDLSDRLGAAVKAVAPDSDLKATVMQARFGRELWKECLILAMLLLIVESIIGRTSPSSPSKAEAK